MNGRDLLNRQLLPLEQKIALTQKRIAEWYDWNDGQVYVSYSGGKDSTVLASIVKDLYPEVPLVFCDTGLEYPEVRSLAIARADEVIRPTMTFKTVIEKYGYPVVSKEQAQYLRELRTTKSEKLRAIRLNGNGNGSGKISSKWLFLADAPFKISEQCCNVMKKHPFSSYEKKTGRRPMIAVMASESSLRKQQYIKNGCNVFESKRPQSRPMGFWTEQDVLMFIRQNNVKIPECYGEIIEAEGRLSTTGEDRTGCMFCMFGAHLDGEPNRFQRMEKSYPKQYRYCMEKLGLADVLDYMGIKRTEDGQ